MLRLMSHPILLRYGCALLTVALVVVCRALLQPVLDEQAPLLLFTIAVMTSAWYGGLGPGLLATCLSTFAGVYFFMEPVRTLVISDPKDKAVMTLFVIIGVMISLLSQSLHSSRRRVEESATTAQEARAEAERANRLKDEFLATISHELRTPLASMLMWTRMLASGNLDTQTSVQAHATLIGNVKLLSQLIEDLLDVSRIVSGKLRIESRPTQLIPVLKAAIEVVRPAAEAKNIKIETTFDPTKCDVLADANRLQQVFWNLLSNAIKFTEPEGSVKIKLEQVDSHARVTISDTGIGIRAEFLPHIFERFYQAGEDGGRRGLGLGLAIVRRLIEMHGGRIEAASPGEGRGATFTVRLPLLVDE